MSIILKSVSTKNSLKTENNVIFINFCELSLVLKIKCIYKTRLSAEFSGSCYFLSTKFDYSKKHTKPDIINKFSNDFFFRKLYRELTVNLLENIYFKFQNLARNTSFLKIKAGNI